MQHIKRRLHNSKKNKVVRIFLAKQMIQTKPDLIEKIKANMFVVIEK
jgi:hypothetical protein